MSSHRWSFSGTGVSTYSSVVGGDSDSDDDAELVREACAVDAWMQPPVGAGDALPPP